MSAYNLTENNILTVRENLDELIICMVNGDLLKRKLGLGKEISEKDIFLFSYLYDFLQERYCDNSIEDDCFLNKINSLYYKYK